MQLFYSKDLSIGGTFTLSPEESRHVAKVLRLSVGDKLKLTNGKGTLFEGKLLKADPRRCEVSIIKKQDGSGQKSFSLHIALAPTKNIGRYEWFLEKVTEIGIEVITPLFTKHSERTIIKRDRLQKIIVAAAKQSLHTLFPVLNEASTFEDFITLGAHQSIEHKYIAHCRDENLQRLNNIYPGGDALILIGPEGDFSEDEVQLAVTKGYIPISLGSTRLRTETAGIVACHMINLKNEEANF